MKQLKTSLYIINDTVIPETIEWLFRTIKDVNIKTLSLEKDLLKLQSIKLNEIYIFNIYEISDKLLDLLRKLVDQPNAENIFIALNNKHTKEVTCLSRIGVKNIYFFPDEEFILRNDVVERVDQIKYIMEVDINKEKINRKFGFDRLIGRSPQFLECIEIAKRISQKGDATILLLGETGTGKELLARAIHYNSDRAEYPFIELNTTAISESLFESELFGYEKGAFTDAKTSKPGLFEIAEGGTIFLDEIGDLSLNLQVKLLRTIENKRIKRVGGIKDIKINCRIIAATNQDLEKFVDEKKFRVDLYYRLKVISILLPPLRERGDDVIILADFFIEQFNKKYNTKIEGLSSKAKQILLQYSWPGNVRELSNVMERAVLLTNSKVITDKDIQLGIGHILSSKKKNQIEIKLEIDKANIANVTSRLVHEVLKLADNNKSQAAKILGISRPSLLKILNKKN